MPPGNLILRGHDRLLGESDQGLLMRDSYRYQLLGCLGSYSRLYSGRRCQQCDGEKALDHGIDLLGHFKLEEMPGPDGLANEELWAEFAEARQIGVWRPGID